MGIVSRGGGRLGLRFFGEPVDDVAGRAPVLVAVDLPSSLGIVMAGGGARRRDGPFSVVGDTAVAAAVVAVASSSSLGIVMASGGARRRDGPFSVVGDTTVATAAVTGTVPASLTTGRSPGTDIFGGARFLPLDVALSAAASDPDGKPARGIRAVPPTAAPVR